MADPFDSPDDRSGPGPEVYADYDSDCGNCGEPVYEGDIIRADGDGWAHTECVDD